MLQTETLDKARHSHRDWTAALGFSATIAPSQCDLKLHDPGSALLHLSSSSPSPATHSSNTVQWKDTVYNPKCSRSFCIINSPWDLLSRTVEHGWPLLFTFPSSSKLHDTKESDGTPLRFPTHRGISVTFRLRHGLLHLPSIFS